jgi:hypothetical protein
MIMSLKMRAEAAEKKAAEYAARDQNEASAEMHRRAEAIRRRMDREAGR